MATASLFEVAYFDFTKNVHNDRVGREAATAVCDTWISRDVEVDNYIALSASGHIFTQISISPSERKIS